jgi:exopolysaccharide biosynthesis protein
MFIVAIVVVSGWLSTPITNAETLQKRPYPAVVYQQIDQANPPRKIFVANIDLTSPDVKIRVSRGGEDPDGPGEWETVLLPPSKIANRENFDVVINGDFFGAKDTKDAEGKASGFVEGIWAKVNGPAVTDGELWGPAKNARPSLIVREGNKVSIQALQDPPKDAQQVVAGSDIILRAGENVAVTTGKFAETQHPRTAVGIADDGKRLVMVVVDGRRKDRVGMKLTELADLMKSLGCKDAMNLDGGGSSEMAIRNPETGQLEVKNSPSDYRERAVGNVLGVTINGAKRVKAPVTMPKKK